MMDKYELQKKGHHEVYGDIDYPKGIWFDIVELESFEYTGYAVVVPESNAVFDIFDTVAEAEEVLATVFASDGPHCEKYCEIWKLEDSYKVAIVNTNRKGGDPLESSESRKDGEESASEKESPCEGNADTANVEDETE